MNQSKNILLSKTFWTQILTVIAALFPPVQEWLVANPVEFVAAVAAVNVLVRFVTSGKVTIFGNDDAGHKSGGVSGLFFLLILVTAVGIVGSLPSCTPGTPVRFELQGPDGTVGYSSKGGLVIGAVIRPEK